MIEIHVRNRDGSLEGQLKRFTQLRASLKGNAVGSWALQFPASALGDALREPGRSIVVVRDGKTLFSGPKWKATEAWADEGEDVAVNGYTDNIILWNRMIYVGKPTADLGAMRFPDRETENKRGPGESVIKAYVADNERPVPGHQRLTIAADLGRGAEVVESPRFDVLGDFIASTAVHAGGLGFDVKAEFDGTEIAPLVFDVYEPVDRRLEAVFSVESGTLASFEKVTSDPTVTTVLVAGRGEGTDRQFVLVESPDAVQRIGRRIEKFVDARQTEAIDELFQKGNEVLSAGAGSTEFKFVPIDRKHRAFGRNYGLQDLVTTESVEGVLAQVDITVNADGEIVEPQTSPTQGTKDPLRLFESVRAIGQRTDGIEKRL